MFLSLLLHISLEQIHIYTFEIDFLHIVNDGTHYVRTHLTLSVMRMENRVWVEAFKLGRFKQQETFEALDLSEEVLLFIIVSWSDDT